MFRSDLVQANERVRRLEAELRAARADRDHFTDATPAMSSPTRDDVARLELDQPSGLALWQWWPLVTAPLLAMIYLLAGDQLGESLDLPVDVLALSGILGSAIYSFDVLLRWQTGKSGVLGRLITVVAVIAGAPALLFGFLAFGGLLGYVGPVIAVIVGLACLINWIATGR